MLGSRLKAARERYGATQVDLAESMGTTQSAISRIERQADLHVNTLARYVAAMGGRLELWVHHPDGSTQIVTPCPGCGSTICKVHKWPPRPACHTAPAARGSAP